MLAAGIIAGVIVGRMNHSAAGALSLRSSNVTSSDQLALWHDPGKTEPVTSLKFEALQLQPPLISLDMPEARIFVGNLTTGDLFLVKPCREVVDSASGVEIGSMGTDVHALNGDRLGNTCDWPPTVVLGSGDTVRADVRIDLVESLATGDYSFQTVFEAGNTVSRIAFVSNRDGNDEIYVMDANGANQTNLTNSPGSDTKPDWSPDGDKIAFVSNRDGGFEIYIMNADGTNQTRLTNNTYNDRYPIWSPDGGQMVFISDRHRALEVYIMNANGTDPTRLTSTGFGESNPDWSPDGGKIVFDANGEINVMDVDDPTQTSLTIDAAPDRDPAWSPDGSRIAFQSLRDGNWEIYIMDADGTSQTNLTAHPAGDLGPTWSSSGSKVAFMSDRNGNPEIYVMDADGSNQRCLTNNAANDTDPDWSLGLVPP